MTESATMTEKSLTQMVQDETGMPWFNGAAFASHHGYPQMAKTIGGAIADLNDVMQALRERGDYAAADRMRSIIGRMARSLPGTEAARYAQDDIQNVAANWT